MNKKYRREYWRTKKLDKPWEWTGSCLFSFYFLFLLPFFSFIFFFLLFSSLSSFFLSEETKRYLSSIFPLSFNHRRTKPKRFFQWGNIDEWFIPTRLYNCCQEWDLSFPRFTWDGKRWRNVKASYTYMCARTCVCEWVYAQDILYTTIFSRIFPLFFLLSPGYRFYF